MWFLSEAMFEYLKERSAGKKILDVFLIITLFTWIAAIYVVASNYESIRQVLFSPKIDMANLVKLDKGINDVLGQIMNELAADRAALGRLHDTVTDVQGRHFLFESRTNEVVQPGVAAIAKIHQNVLLSMINLWAQSFIKNECVYTSDLQRTDIFYEFYRETGTKADIKCPVFGTDNTWLGYIMIEYTTKNPPTKELKLLEGKVREAAVKIGAILSINNSANVISK
jgi:hypothetical protein